MRSLFIFVQTATAEHRMTDIPSHHRIFGTCIDYLTGESIIDTDDERYRQKLARMLIEEKGYQRQELESRLRIETLFAGQYVVSTIDFVVSVQGRRFMVIRYGPGSLVTRERPAIAAARVLDVANQLPLTVVSNGEQAEILDTYTGKVKLHGLHNIPDRDTAKSLLPQLIFAPLTDPGRRERELRILNAFDAEACCVGGPCPLPDAPEG
jgi:hypothetical protein